MKEQQINIEKIGQCIIKNWSPEDANAIYDIEHQNWAPWLEAKPPSLKGRAQVFPEGQLMMCSPNNEILATLSTNRINWDGQNNGLPTWDQVAGDPTTYEKTYSENGNALVLMSMSVNPEYKKSGLATLLVKEVVGLAKQLNIEYLVGSFRPNEFGGYKKNNNPFCDFTEYCQMVRDDNQPKDAWLRSLIRNGMKPIAVDHHAMAVTISLEEFNELKLQYNPSNWLQLENNTWECGEVGSWQINTDNTATYIESNLWGQIPLQ